ncbi:MFS transporter [Kineosporia succinea]|uniref:MFS family permease n=1 Tax=Kineosporia succinea TaxID=84632 RepID=A0ABT9P3F3_9ACTN|nr:MFS transporter [Kineosporia succinea]MDP9826725.1 MFS family permease [Kineosporia succinea]
MTVTSRPPNGAAPGTVPRQRAWLVVAVLMAMIGWGGNEFTPLVVMYRAHGYSTVGVDALLAAYVVGLIPGLLVASALSDRHGRRPLMLLGGIASVAGSLLIALGPLGAGWVAAGRLVSGLAIGIAMSVGTSWVKELSTPEFDPSVTAGTGARRASLTLTVGFALGPGVAGILAQWAPWQRVLPYLVHAVLTVPTLVLLMVAAVETRSDDPGNRPLGQRLRVPKAGHRRFVRVVLPLGPWIFGTVGVAYVVMPQMVDEQVGDRALILSTALTVATLAAGVLIQPVARRLDDVSTARACVVSMVLVTLGMAAAALAAHLAVVWLVFVVGVLLGCAYGIAVVSGLLEVQRIAAPDELAGLTGVYYALTYLGFTLPLILAALSRWFTYPQMLLTVCVLAAVCTAGIASAWARHLPEPAV